MRIAVHTVFSRVLQTPGNYGMKSGCCDGQCMFCLARICFRFGNYCVLHAGYGVDCPVLLS